MIAFLFLTAHALAATLLDTTYGVVGRDVEVLGAADQAYALVSQQDWEGCSSRVD